MGEKNCLFIIYLKYFHFFFHWVMKDNLKILTFEKSLHEIKTYLELFSNYFTRVLRVCLCPQDRGLSGGRGQRAE